jgi:hypothetical protein
MDKANLKSILVITVGFTIIGFFTHSDWPFYVAVTVGIVSIISERAAGFINTIWFGLARVLGYINSRILLTIIYYFFLFPLSLISRLSGKKSIILKQNDTSYYSIRNHQYEKADLENPW